MLFHSRRLKEAGWVESRDDEDGDGSVRFFKITGNGLAALPRLAEIQGLFFWGVSA